MPTAVSYLASAGDWHLVASSKNLTAHTLARRHHHQHHHHHHQSDPLQSLGVARRGCSVVTRPTCLRDRALRAPAASPTSLPWRRRRLRRHGYRCDGGHVTPDAVTSRRRLFSPATAQIIGRLSCGWCDMLRNSQHSSPPHPHQSPVRLWLSWSMSNLRLRCDHFVGKVSAMGQPTRPTQPSILSGSINE